MAVLVPLGTSTAKAVAAVAVLEALLMVQTDRESTEAVWVVAMAQQLPLTAALEIQIPVAVAEEAPDRDKLGAKDRLPVEAVK